MTVGTPIALRLGHMACSVWTGSLLILDCRRSSSACANLLGPEFLQTLYQGLDTILPIRGILPLPFDASLAFHPVPIGEKISELFLERLHKRLMPCGV